MRVKHQIKFRSCPLCENTSAFTIKHFSYALFDDSPLDDSYNLMSCSKCGFSFFDTKSTTDDFYNYYMQNRHYMAENYGTGALIKKEKERYVSVLSVLQTHRLNKLSRLIDIGSAKGGLLSFLKARGYKNLLAIDLLPECVNFIRTNNIEAKIGSVEALPLNDASIDVVVLSHVLEHVLDLQAAMKELRRVIAEGGLVYAEVPTIEYGCSFKSAPMWDFIYEHVNYFSKYHLIHLFQSNQFACLESGVKELRNGEGVIRCAYGVFFKKDHFSSKNIPYFNMVEKIAKILCLWDDSKFSKIKKIVEDKKPCYVWGISAYMQFLIKETLVGKCNIISFLDKSAYKQSKRINKIYIKSPELLQKISNKNETIVIFSAGPWLNDMKQYLNTINFLGQRIII